MRLFRNLLKLIPNYKVRSIVRRVGVTADKAVTHGIYEADRAAFFDEAEKTGERIIRAEFPVLPATLAELVTSPYNDLRTPINTAALFIVALNTYSQNREESIAMINYLRGANPMSADDVRFLDESLAKNNAENHLAQSYLEGATAQNGYTPSQPNTVVTIDNPYTYLATNSGAKEYANLLIQCGETEKSRSITMRNVGGLWYLWEYAALLNEI
jgi:hypothetical protein